MQKAVLMLPVLIAVFAKGGDQSTGQGKVVRKYTQPGIGEVTVSKLNNGDIAVGFSDNTNNASLERSQEFKEWSKLEQKLPYRGKPYIRMGTLGQQAKLCDWVVIGRISHIERGGEVSKEYPITLTLGIETNLFGKLRQDSVKLSLKKWDFGAAEEELTARFTRSYHVGDRFLVFLVRGRAPVLFDILLFTFEKPAHRKEFGDQPALLYDSLGLFGLDSGEVEREVLSATECYLTCLRKEKRDLENYYRLLRRLERSPVERVRDDAKTDLMNLFSTPEIVEKVLVDETVDKGIRDYARFVLETQKKRKVDR